MNRQEKNGQLSHSLTPLGFELPEGGIVIPSTRNLEHLYKLKISFNMPPTAEETWVLEREAEILRILDSHGITMEMFEYHKTNCGEDKCFFFGWLNKDMVDAMFDEPDTHA